MPDCYDYGIYSFVYLRYYSAIGILMATLLPGIHPPALVGVVAGFMDLFLSIYISKLSLSIYAI